MRYAFFRPIGAVFCVWLAASSPVAAAEKAEQCRDERRKGPAGQAQVPITDPIFIQNEVAVPVFYRVKIWTSEESKVNAGKCVRLPFPQGFERLRTVNMEVYVKGDRADKCNINATVGYKVVV
ncbi:MAG: hypothetical protein FJ271_32455 [Planctomycetes bacterium]|nr:hypothetical protein [Planctomycetota bacterium]